MPKFQVSWLRDGGRGEFILEAASEAALRAELHARKYSIVDVRPATEVERQGRAFYFQ